MFGSIFHWFYCLDFPDAVLVIALGAWLFLALTHRFHNSRIWKWLTAAALLSWLFAALYATILTRGDGQAYPLNLTPFHSYREAISSGNREIYRSNFMNAALFYPAGLATAALLPQKWRGWLRCIVVLLLFAALSTGIEFAQYRCGLGKCEIDDVIHNTLGALLGCLTVAAARNRIFSR